MTARPSVAGEVLRHSVRDLLATIPDTPREITRHLLDLARRHDGRGISTAAEVAAAATGRWVRRACGNAGPGVPGVGHVAADGCVAMDDAVAVCGTKLRGRLDWAHTARVGNHGDGWRVCRACARTLVVPSAAVIELVHPGPARPDHKPVRRTA